MAVRAADDTQWPLASRLGTVAQMTAADRVESTAAALIDAARSAGMMVTGDKRVSEADAAQLLGYAPGHLKNMRSEREGPQHFRVGLNGCRVSYRLFDLATWIEAKREE